MSKFKVVKQEDKDIEENRSRVFSFMSFLFNYIYYTLTGRYIWGIVGVVAIAVAPLELYFVISFIEAVVFFLRSKKEKCKTLVIGKVKISNVTVTCFLSILLIVSKILFYRYGLW